MAEEPEEKAVPKQRSPWAIRHARASIEIGTFFIHGHARDRMRTRGITRDEVIAVIRTAETHAEERFLKHASPPNWYYTLESVVEGRFLRVVLYLTEIEGQDGKRTTVYTVIDLDG